MSGPVGGRRISGRAADGAKEHELGLVERRGGAKAGREHLGEAVPARVDVPIHTAAQLSDFWTRLNLVFFFF